MKYYAIKIAENQYNVIEVDGRTEKLGAYQVDETVVRKMYELAQQNKLNLVIQESNGATSYLNLNLDRAAVSIDYNLKKLLLGINFLIIAVGFYEKLLVIPLYVLLVALNVIVYYYYYKKNKRTDGHFIFESSRYEIQGTEIDLKKTFRNRQCIFLSLSTVLFGIYIVNHFFISILPFNSMTLFTLILFDLLVVSMCGKNLHKEDIANYRGMQPIINENHQICWIKSNEITRYRKFNYRNNVKVVNTMVSQGNNTDFATTATSPKNWFKRIYDKHKVLTIICVILLVGFIGNTVMIAVGNIGSGEATCTVSKKGENTGRNGEGYYVICDGTHYVVQKSNSFFGLNKEISSKERDERYKIIQVGKKYDIKHVGLNKNIIEITEVN